MRKARKEDAWIKLMCDPNDDSQSQAAGLQTGGDVVQAPTAVPRTDGIPSSLEGIAC